MIPCGGQVPRQGCLLGPLYPVWGWAGASRPRLWSRSEQSRLEGGAGVKAARGARAAGALGPAWVSVLLGASGRPGPGARLSLQHTRTCVVGSASFLALVSSVGTQHPQKRVILVKPPFPSPTGQR